MLKSVRTVEVALFLSIRPAVTVTGGYSLPLIRLNYSYSSRKQWLKKNKLAEFDSFFFLPPPRRQRVLLSFLHNIHLNCKRSKKIHMPQSFSSYQNSQQGVDKQVKNVLCWKSAPRGRKWGKAGEGRILWGSKKEMEPLQCDGQDLKRQVSSVYRCISLQCVSGRGLVFVQVLELPLSVSVTYAGLSVRKK